MFERYTEKARRSIFFARYYASQTPTGAIECEHVLLGLMREDVLLRIKLTAGDAEAIQREIEQGFPPPNQAIPTSADLPLSDAARRILSRAAEEADELDHRPIDTSHLVLGLLRAEGRSADVLKKYAVDYATYRRTVAGSPPSGPFETDVPKHLEGSAGRIAARAPSLQEAVARLDQLVERTVDHCQALTDSYGDKRLARKPSWTRMEALGQLIDWASVHHGWFARAMTEPRLSVPGYPQEDWVAAQRYDTMSWRDLLSLWASLSRLLIHVLAQIPEEALNRVCQIGIEEPITVKELALRYVDRCHDLVGQILTRD